MNIRFIIILSFTFLQMSNVFAQSELRGKIQELNNETIAFASVKLINLEDSTSFKNSQSDDNGIYKFSNIKKGKYIIIIKMISYKNYRSEIIEIDGNSNYESNHKITSENITTNEVVISGQKKSINFEDGKMIVDIENTMGNAGLTAIEVLRKTPGVSVDQDGKIQVKGKGGVIVQIDDKNMYMSEEQLANLLRSIPSDQIKEIEVISAPSAKQDASGNAGIINIKLKKAAYEGLTGSVNGSLGTGVYHKNSIGANINYKKKKLFLNSAYQYGNRQGYSVNSNDRNNGNQSFLVNRSVYQTPNDNHNFSLNGEYAFTDKFSFTYDLNQSLGSWNWTGNTNSKLYNSQYQIDTNYINHDNGNTEWLNSYSSLGFKYKLDTNGTLLSGYGAFNYNDGISEKHLNIDKFDNTLQNLNNPFIFNQTNHFNSIKHNAQIDFLKKPTKELKIETGIKYIAQNNFSPNNVYITQNHTDINNSNHFRYEEQIYAAYFMTSFIKAKWNIQAGLRYEKTNVKGTISLIDSTFYRNYQNIFPSGTITFKATEKTSYILQYSKRITRPEGDQLNPVLNIIDPYTSWGGDPYLLPQFAHNTEFTTSFFKGFFLNTINYTYIQNPLMWAFKYNVSNKKYISGQRNLDYQKSTGASISVNGSPLKWWTSNNNIFMTYNIIVGQTDLGKIRNERFSWTYKSTQSFKLPKEIGIEISGIYDSPSAYAFAYSYSRWQLNLAIQKKIFDKKGLIKLAVNDMFWSYYYGGTNQSGVVSQKSKFYWDNRTIMLSFSYKFGKKVILVTGRE